jgi:hypothetical protein
MCKTIFKSTAVVIAKTRDHYRPAQCGEAEHAITSREAIARANSIDPDSAEAIAASSHLFNESASRWIPRDPTSRI